MIDSEKLFDKMYGGWFGKNIGGTLGGPLEGTMELMDVTFYTQEFAGPMENDDLDLQLVNLHAIEEYGPLINAQHLSNAWESHVFFPFDEYGHAATNIRKKLASPLSGKYNNFFTDCMGSPIRSEIWGMLCAGNPKLATYYAYQDAIVDHAGGEGVFGEVFFAALESMAFECDDIVKLTVDALTYIPEDCVTSKAVSETLRLYNSGMPWKETRQKLLDKYATPNFTYAPLNIAFTVLALLYGGNNFSDCVLIATNCGYDTDCTAATAGAIYGILYGKTAIPQEWIAPIGSSIKVSAAVNGFNAPKTIEELTNRTLAAHNIVMAVYENVTDKSVFEVNYNTDACVFRLPHGAFVGGDLDVTLMVEENNPVICRGGKKQIVIEMKNLMTVDYEGTIHIDAPVGFVADDKQQFMIAPNGKFTYKTVIENIGEMNYTNSFNICIERFVKNSIWTKYAINFVLLPPFKWEVKTPSMNSFVTIHCITNRVNFEEVDMALPNGSYEMRTALSVPTEREVDLIVSTCSGVKMMVDGEVVVDSQIYSPFIPAYHRSEPSKRKVMNLSAGLHNVSIIVNKTSDDIPFDVNFMAVQPGASSYMGYDVEIMQV